MVLKTFFVVFYLNVVFYNSVSYWTKEEFSTKVGKCVGTSPIVGCLVLILPCISGSCVHQLTQVHNLTAVPLEPVSVPDIFH